MNWPRIVEEDSAKLTEYQSEDLSVSSQKMSSWCFLAKCEAICDEVPRMMATDKRQTKRENRPKNVANLSKDFILNILKVA